MNVQQKNKEKGFTIIEVVLVLAIAGLIFLMVFIALPALQRNQRDTQRKNDMGRVQTAIQSYQSNNRNALPQDAVLTSSTDTGFISQYLSVGGDSFSDPDGTAYSFKSGTANDFDHIVYFTRRAVCNGETLTTNQGNQKIAFQYKLEGGGVACVSN
ncbi:MAG TPA: type II secretion system protein [Candidatus Saccharimonadales bacterium]|nr:type II secretion system protein [Candidatus Saccharimonadales bacterium]